MNTHELARILLDRPDMPVSVHLNNTAAHHHLAVGQARVFLDAGKGQDRMLIGNFHKMDVSDTVIVTQVFHGRVFG